jgi:hypothetical protein
MTTTITESALVSEDWQLAAEDGTKPTALVIQLRRRAHVLPWFRFIYAEGDNTQVQIAFASHMVTITGSGLAALLAALAIQRVIRIVQPTESEAKFSVRGPAAGKYTGPAITNITVEKFK